MLRPSIALLAAGCALGPAEAPTAAEVALHAARIAEPCDVRVPTDQPTVQAGVDVASDGDTVCVFAGTYVENVVIPASRELRLVGDGARRTILDGGGAGPVVSIGGTASPLTLASLTLRGGTVGLEVSEASASLEDVTVSGNAPNGGIDAERGSLDLAGVRITGNRDDFRGGGLGTWLESVTGTDVEITGNRAERGGGIYGDESRLELDRATILSNRATDPTMGGGGIGGYTLAGALRASIVAGNVAAGGRGGGALLEGYDSFSFENVVLAGNRAADGGATQNEVPYSTISFVDVVAARNRATTGVGGLGSANGGTNAVTYSDLWRNTGPVLQPDDPVGSAGNVAVDPQFTAFSLSAPARSWDFHLAAGSALVDAGDPALTDPDGSRSDIGAYGGPSAE